MKPGIRGKLTLHTVFFILLLLVLYNVYILTKERRLLSEQLKSKSIALLSSLTIPISKDLLSSDYDAIDLYIFELTKKKGKQFQDLKSILIANTKGTIVGHNEENRFGEKVSDEFDKRAVKVNRQIVFLAKGSSVIKVSVPIYVSNESSNIRVGTAISEIETSSVDRMINQTSKDIIMVSFALLLITACILYLALSREVIKPIELLKSAANNFKEGHFKFRIHLQTNDEFEDLSIVIQEMTRKAREYNRELEKKVSIRTLDLKKANMALQETNEKLERLAITDGLTGLYNHRYFQETLAHEIKRSERNNRNLGLLLFDVDHFKKFNDTYGHPAGDAILKEIAKVLRLHLRSIDTAARYGGEEFVTILPETSREDSQTTAEKIRSIVEEHSYPNSHKVTVSIGVANFPDDGSNPSQIIQAADKALYAAKLGGRNQVVVYGSSKSFQS